MDPSNQKQIKEFAETYGNDNLVVVLGAGDIEGAEITAETVTEGDPAFAGPLAGVSLRLPKFNILEPEVKKAIPAES